MDGLWQWVSELVFVRFAFDIPVPTLREFDKRGKVCFALTQGGIVEWLIMTSWCRSQGFGAILVSNRKRILLFAKPLYFLQIVFRRRSYRDLFLSSQTGARLIFCPSTERKQLFNSTRGERLFHDLLAASRTEPTTDVLVVPVVILWKRFLRADKKSVSEYLLGLGSDPNLIGKLWYLLWRRQDSTVKALGVMDLGTIELGPNDPTDMMAESELGRAARILRRKIIVMVQQEMRVVLGPRFHSLHWVKESIFRDPELQALIKKIAKEEGVDEKRVMMRAYQYLGEIAADYRLRFIELMSAFLHWLFSRVFEGIDSKPEELQKVRDVMKHKSVVFAASHRSHFDYLVIPHLLFTNEMITPHIVAGINLAFWPVGYFLRMGGAFFIRRSFRNNAVYSMCLRKYIAYLLHHRVNIKFFIEGTRSRTGKMLAPAYGILKMVVDVCQRGMVEDIALVPVVIMYDEVFEQSSYTKELRGEKKEKESAASLIRSRSVIGRNFGKVYTRFANPIDIKPILSSGASSGEVEPRVLQKLAFQICKSINDVCPITIKAIVSSALLTNPQKMAPLDRWHVVFQCYYDLLISQSYPLAFRTSSREFSEQAGAVIHKLQKSGGLSSSQTVPKLFGLDERRRVALNYYKNNAIHALIVPAITLAAIAECNQSSDEWESTPLLVSSILDVGLELRNLLKFEFFFSPSHEFGDEMKRHLIYFIGEDYAALTPAELFSRFENRRFSVRGDHRCFLRVFGDILEGYLVAMRFMKSAKLGISVEKKVLIQSILGFGQRELEAGRVDYAESVSVFIYGNAVQLFANLGLVEESVSESGSGMVTVLDWDFGWERLYERIENTLRLME